MTAGNQPSSSGSAPVVKSFTGSTKNDRCLEVWFADEVTDETRAWLLEAINEKALRGAAQGVLDRGDVARVICCGSTGCQFVGDSEDGSKCYCDTSDFHGSRVERKTGAILALSVVTPSPGAGEPREKEITRLATIEECADIVEGQIVHHNCREWPAVSSQGNRASDDPIVQHCDKLAAAIRTLALTSTDKSGAA